MNRHQRRAAAAKRELKFKLVPTTKEDGRAVLEAFHEGHVADDTFDFIAANVILMDDLWFWLKFVCLNGVNMVQMSVLCPEPLSERVLMRVFERPKLGGRMDTVRQRYVPEFLSPANIFSVPTPQEHT